MPGSRRSTAGVQRSEDRRPLACVIGEYDLVRALAVADIPVAVVARRGYPSRYSRAAAPAFEFLDPWSEPAALVERLLAFAAESGERPLLFYDGDADLLLISRNRDRLRQAFRFVVPDVDLVEALVDKAAFQELAARLELPVPRAERLAVPGGLDRDLELRYPVLLKPLTRQSAAWEPLAHAKAIHVENKDALRSAGERLGAGTGEVIVQEVIPGPETAIESYHVYVDGEGAVAGEFTGRKIRTRPRRYGYSTAVMITDEQEVVALGRKVIDRLNFRGVAKLDFKRGPDGRLHLLEINPRFSLWHHPGALAGVNLPALVYADLSGSGRPAAGPVRPGVRWCNPLRDLQAAREDGISTARWLAWAASCEAKSGFARDDPLPLARAAIWRLGTRLRSLLPAGVRGPHRAERPGDRAGG